MLSKFTSVLETHFQNTETALKNQQASIQGLETQIGQLSKLISERPQGSLPSNTEPNPREHLNSISTQDKEGFIAPEPELMQETVVSKGKSEVGDKVLLDVVDPHVVTTTPNEEIPLTILSIFPFSTVEVSHPKFGSFKHTRLGTRACLKPWPNRGRDTTVRYGRVEAGHDFPKTRDAINPHGRVSWLWVNLIGEHGCGNRKRWTCQGQARFYFFDTGMRHDRAVKPWTTIHGRGTLTHGRGRSEQI
ncbi:hypothetical protein GOBAR_AA20967 [Gossypium barbadense]|uniref:Uncharacterized protein n=1 Tax=Gossypium barbadense TaxID=3634 RepID=A0A2P5X8N3_GOSBA|nr:hypothetical protein GOBAR_AA20967 [Gossypium barbadense]